jgi:ketosteroid isomerase-like protein
MNQYLIWLVIWSMALCAAYGQGGDADNPAAAIRRQYADWLKAYGQMDLARTMEIFAPEVISTFAGASDNDVTEMRQSYDKSFAAEGPSRRWKPVDLEIGASGDLAYALADWELVNGTNGAANVRLTNRSIDVLKRDGANWKIIRSFTIPKDRREVELSCDITLPRVSPETFSGGAREVWQTLMRWRDSYNPRDLTGTLAPYDPSITGLYAGNAPDNFNSLRDSYTRSFAATDRQRSIEFEPEEILASGNFAFVRDHWTSTMRTQERESRRVSRGIELWRKNDRGEWKLLHYLSYLVCNSEQPR